MGFTQVEKDQIVEFLARNPIGIISTVGKDGTPAGAVVYLAPTKDLNLYFLTRIETQKMDNVLDTGAVAVTVFDPRTLENLQAEGKAVPVTDVHESREAITMIQKIIGKEKASWISPAEEVIPGATHQDTSKWVPPSSQLGKGGFICVKVEPKSVRFRKYESEHIDAQDFEEHQGTF